MTLTGKLSLFGIVLLTIFAFIGADRINKNMPPSDEKILLKLQIEEKKLQLMRLKGDGNCKTEMYRLQGSLQA